MPRILASALLAAAWAVPAHAGSRPVVVELFTSEECSSRGVDAASAQGAGLLLLGTALWLASLLGDVTETAAAAAVLALLALLLLATWCLSCKLNALSTLDTEAVRHRLSDPGLLRMRADWSRPDPRISAFLQSFDRFGIPFDVVYGPSRPTGEALPELLTPATLLAALDRAGGTDRVETP